MDSSWGAGWAAGVARGVVKPECSRMSSERIGSAEDVMDGRIGDLGVTSEVQRVFAAIEYSLKTRAVVEAEII